NIRADAWKYRDWVIQSMNQDMPYDRFIALQLAGDELEPENASARIATMFCLSGPDMPDINSQQERRHQLLNEMTSTVASVLMGLQLECAQCHDHKYDPLSQADFYRMRSIFEPAVHLVKNKSVGTLQEKNGTPPQSYLMVRGDYRRQGPPVSPAFPRIANPAGRQLEANRPGAPSSGRRSELVDWLTGPDHLLTSRVIANRIWQYHFGRGLVETPSDFGIMGQAPSHPELLDWLASELVRSGWSLKHIQRLILTSNAWQQSSVPQADAVRIDAATRLLWRFPPRRLEAEAIRDSIVAVSGALNPKMGGPGFSGFEVEMENVRHFFPKVDYGPDDFRRMVYMTKIRQERESVFGAFDCPDASQVISKRSRSTTPLQALNLLNSTFVVQQSETLSKRLKKQNDSLAEQVQLAYLLCFGRNADIDEASDAARFAKEFGLVSLCRGLLNSNEFLFIP
ncbi:MAG TPA: DUF1553 domain-containing protein, partial [Fuerstia sp.]|nr:DUF1553 domain-containing protein [Fuerstiella sp.]